VYIGGPPFQRTPRLPHALPCQCGLGERCSNVDAPPGKRQYAQERRPGRTGGKHWLIALLSCLVPALTVHLLCTCFDHQSKSASRLTRLCTCSVVRLVFERHAAVLQGTMAAASRLQKLHMRANGGGRKMQEARRCINQTCAELHLSTRISSHALELFDKVGGGGGVSVRLDSIH
jgi:hypothetical protein